MLCQQGYSGYGAEQGEKKLRVAIASTYYADLGIEQDDIFVSDGTKIDISHLQTGKRAIWVQYTGFNGGILVPRYTNMHADYKEQGYDRLLDIIEKIKNKPDDRRIILSAWNHSDLNLMALPTCHMFAQFYVAKGELSCQMYQCSADIGLGVLFNIASYALLTSMIAHVCALVSGDFFHVIGDAYVYKTHISSLLGQLKKLPKTFPNIDYQHPEKGY